mmetsp:Transcript_36405/g.46362  ORF Transcript_36405/g.46362 Transcript_36405/m.46362 type:complete len:133 (+) Transcript_36405:35-433(+)
MNRDSSYSVGLDPESAALKIQAIARGRQARQRPSYIEHQTLKARREEAAVKIQAVQRGQKARHRKQLTVEQNVAAMKIQEVHRRRLQMRKALAKKAWWLHSQAGRYPRRTVLAWTQPFHLDPLLHPPQPSRP